MGGKGRSAGRLPTLDSMTNRSRQRRTTTHTVTNCTIDGRAALERRSKVKVEEQPWSLENDVCRVAS
jgi:hypothetical protein